MMVMLMVVMMVEKLFDKIPCPHTAETLEIHMMQNQPHILKD